MAQELSAVEEQRKRAAAVEAESAKVKKVVVTGDGIAGLFPAPVSEKVSVDWGDKVLEFEVVRMDNETFARIGDKINAGLDLESIKGALGGMKVISDLYWPALKVVLPKCCISPKVIDGESTDPKVISVNRLGLDVGIILLDKIMALSGLGEVAEEKRKN